MNIDELDVATLERMYEDGLIGLRDMPEWKAWYDMKYRCYNPNNPSWKDYGGRGIKVCDRWLESYWTFLWDVGRRPIDNGLWLRSYWSIDRINNDGDYEPGNCKWSDHFEQAENKRSNGYLPGSGACDLAGENNGNVWLSEEQASEILWLALEGRHSLPAIADGYDVGIGAVKGIKYGKNWRGIEPKAPSESRIQEIIKSRWPKTGLVRRM